MTLAAQALRDAFWAALPAQSQWRQRQSAESDDALFEQLAQHGRACANAAQRYGDRGEQLIRNVADNVALKFWELITDPKAQAPRTDADRLADARVWAPATRAMLLAAQAQARNGTTA